MSKLAHLIAQEHRASSKMIYMSGVPLATANYAHDRLNEFRKTNHSQEFHAT